jgi:hypothetical protein
MRRPLSTIERYLQVRNARLRVFAPRHWRANLQIMGGFGDA